MTAINIISKDLKILVFRSNIATFQSAELVRKKLLQMDDVFKVNIDFSDPENVLRVECCPGCPPERIERQVVELRYNCTEFTHY